MRIAVIGATGRTGQCVARQALRRGHEVIAIARTPDSIVAEDHLQVRRADILDPEGIAAALAGADAVVSTVGIGTSRAPTELYSTGMTNVLAAMGATGAGRIAAVSAAPAGPRHKQPFVERRIAMPMLDLFFGATYADMRRMETVLAGSEADWVVLRPPRLVNKPARGTYRFDTQPVSKARQITHGDLATALLDALDRSDLWRHTAYVAN